MFKRLLLLSVIAVSAVTGCAATSAPYHSRIGDYHDNGNFLPSSEWSYREDSLFVSERPDAPSHLATIGVYTHTKTGTTIVASRLPNRLAEADILADVEREALMRQHVEVGDLEVGKVNCAARYSKRTNGVTETVIVFRKPGENRGITRLVITPHGSFDTRRVNPFGYFSAN